jgi:hypothetical protein
MSANINALYDKDLLNMLNQIKNNLEQSKQTMYELENKIKAKSKIEAIIKLQFLYAGSIYSNLEILTDVIMLNIYTIMDLQNRIKNLPTRREVEASRVEVAKLKGKAKKSLEIIKKEHEKLKEQEKRVADIYG